MPAAAPKRILALDGGGIRGIYSLLVLRRIEEIFCEERGNPRLVLRDCFDFFAGTSTGAIIATLLAWGFRVDDILDLYRRRGAEMFTKVGLLDRKDSAYASGPLEQVFQEIVGAETLGTTRLWHPADPARQKVILVIMRNATTGSAWPVCNHPAAKYNARDRANCNLQVPLWQLLRGSTAAPTFFRPQAITLGGRTDLFVDGGMTPYNNPALIAALMATLPAYGINWPAGPADLQLVSIGTLIRRTTLKKTKLPLVGELVTTGFVDSVVFAANALLDAVAIEQDLLCRVLGRCVHGEPIDREIGDLHTASLLAPAEKKFRYVRYNEVLPEATVKAIEARTGQPFGLDNLGLIPELTALGDAYAREHVRREHFFPEPPPA